MTTLGKFIVVEGLEGAGKTTAIQTIKQFLTPLVPSVMVTREPGGTHVGEVVRSLIKENIVNEPLNDYTELLLLYAARVQLIEQVIKPCLQQGTWVIADRFELSTYAYQGGGRKLDKSMIANLSAIALKGFKPDLILFMDIDSEQGLKRVALRGQIDRIEQESTLFFDNVSKAYHEAIKTLDNVEVIDARQDLAYVQESILAHMKQFVANHVKN